MLSVIDQEIARLQQVRSLLGGGSTVVRRGPGRPPKSASAPAKKSGRGRRKGGMSPEGRRRIAEAQKKRWAAIKAAKGKK